MLSNRFATTVATRTAQHPHTDHCDAHQHDDLFIVHDALLSIQSTTRNFGCFCDSTLTIIHLLPQLLLVLAGPLPTNLLRLLRPEDLHVFAPWAYQVVSLSFQGVPAQTDHMSY